MPTRGGLPGCAVSSCVDRDRLAFCPQACTMVGHSWMSCCQAVVVKKVMDKAGMVKTDRCSLSVLSQDEAAAYGDPIARAWTAIRDQCAPWGVAQLLYVSGQGA